MGTEMLNYDELRKCAEAGADPQAMIQYSAILLNDHENGSLSKAVDLIERANQLYPDNLEITERYAHLQGIQGYVFKQMDLYDPAYISYTKCINAIDMLKNRQYNPESVRKLEIESCIEYGEVAIKKRERDVALKMFKRTDVHMYPQAAVLTASIHYESLEKYAKYIVDDITILKSVLRENNWKCDAHKAAAYYLLSQFYANGVAGVLAPDINYAYECILRCSQIDTYLAEDELKKYSKSLFGKIKYRG